MIHSLLINDGKLLDNSAIVALFIDSDIVDDGAEIVDGAEITEEELTEYRDYLKDQLKMIKKLSKSKK